MFKNISACHFTIRGPVHWFDHHLIMTLLSRGTGTGKRISVTKGLGETELVCPFYLLYQMLPSVPIPAHQGFFSPTPLPH